MQSNYWGTTDPEEFDERVDGPAVLEPVLAKSSAILASSVFCTVWDNVDQKRLTDASVQLKVSAFNPVTNNTEGIYAFPAIAEGQYSVLVNAPGYLRGSMNLNVAGGELKSVTIAMRREIPAEPGGLCPMPAEATARRLGEMRGDLFLAGLTLRDAYCG